MRTGATANPVLIIGGGLAGLVAARLLHTAGLAFELLEARGRLGGRILSADASGEVSTDGFDLGPSWFWPGMQPGMAALVEELGLPCFAQNSAGGVVIQRHPREAPQRYDGLSQEPASMRIAGGTGALVAALASGLPASCVHLHAKVTGIELVDNAIEVSLAGPTGPERRLRGSHGLLALPPRLIEATIPFAPALDPAMARRWRATPTWMAPHAKIFAIYDRPFWREAGLSGSAQSTVGPLVEVHDATTASGKAALFGFVGVPADARLSAGQDALVAACVRQLASLFGPDAARPVATLFKDWAADPFTATVDDRAAGGHPSPDRRPWVTGAWEGRISLMGSETSITDPGYFAGAVEAAQRAVSDLMSGAGARTQGAPKHPLSTGAR